MRAVILVPRRADGGHRDELWKFARTWWENDFPDVPIFEGHHQQGPFNRAAAINRAAIDAGDWDVAVVIDSDVLANADAVRSAIDIAASTNMMVVSHDERIMLTQQGTKKILNGYRGNWRVRGVQERVYGDSVSCSVVISRQLWDLVDGFDELFQGWGYEDTAFRIAAETLTGKPLIRLSSEIFHLWHPLSPEAKPGCPTFRANGIRVQRYRDARWKPDDLRILLAETANVVAGEPLPATTIPRILHRTVPTETSEEVEGWWRRFQQLHPGWELRTHREPLDPELWPLTADLWDRCQNGAQKAGLVRLECLFSHGGIYVDSDVEPFRSFEPLLHSPAFAGWEDESTVPDAVLGSKSGHPAFEQMLEKARAVITGGGDAWQSGPGVTTETLPGRHDVLLLPPGAFYPHHYLEKSAAGTRTSAGWVFCEHKWHHSWGSEAQKRSIEKRQRA